MWFDFAHQPGDVVRLRSPTGGCGSTSLTNRGMWFDFAHQPGDEGEIINAQFSFKIFPVYILQCVVRLLVYPCVVGRFRQ
jgi:hypothetical protein